MIEMEELRHLVALADYGTLSAAAEELHISQPSLTRTMKHLEEEMQVSLFERSKNRLQPNETGRLMTEKARALLSQMDSMITSVQAFDRQQRTFILGSIAPLPLWALQRAIAEAHPEKTISTELRGEKQLLDGIRNGAYHLVVLPSAVEDDKLICTRLFEECLYFALPKQHPKAGAKKLSFQDMDGSMFLMANNIGFWHEIHNTKMPHTKFLMQDEYETFRELVHASSLPSFTSNQVMKREGTPNGRVTIPITDPEASVTYYVVCKKENWKQFEKQVKSIQV